MFPSCSVAQVPQSKSFKVLSYTLLQTLTQSPHFLSTAVMVRVRVSKKCMLCCSIYSLDYQSFELSNLWMIDT